ncbi:hypothetical protein HY492_02080 [Candidatus Woesearchaeota archaeon]|nr:hypothetical protein [Candidatus Woesearchaeota archaeon]
MSCGNASDGPKHISFYITAFLADALPEMRAALESKPYQYQDIAAEIKAAAKIVPWPPSIEDLFTNESSN